MGTARIGVNPGVPAQRGSAMVIPRLAANPRRSGNRLAIPSRAGPAGTTVGVGHPVDR